MSVKLFQSNHYPAFMFLLILSILMLTLFNLSSIFEKTSNQDQFQKNNAISGFISLRLDSNFSQTSQISETEKPSFNGYLVYYSVLGFLCLVLYLLIKFIYLR